MAATARHRLHQVAWIGALLFVHLTPLCVVDAHAEIANIATFLEQCPTADPAYAQIRQDFVIRRNGAVVGTIPCTAPVSAIPIAQYTDELIVVQGLRAIFYMDQGRSGHLPWTSGTVYDWMKSRIRGINLSDTASSSFCCQSLDGGQYIVVKAQNEQNRHFDRTWEGIAGNIGLYAHESRHVDGFFHDSGCGITNGCDPTYNEANLSAYAIQWWLESKWLSGYVYVGFSCLDAATRSAIANHHFTAANFTFRSRFSSNPPLLLAMPANPGGECKTTATPGTPSNVQANVLGSTLAVTWLAPTSGAAPTAYRLNFFAGGVPVASVMVGTATAASLTIPAGLTGTYTVVVVALAGTAAGPPSASASFTLGGATSCTGPPPPPTGLAGSVTAGTALVTWSAAAGATSYIVRAGSQLGASDLYNASIGNVVAVSASGLPAGFQAFVRIVSVNDCGQSAASAEIMLK